MTIELIEIGAEAAVAIANGHAPEGLAFADDYPTEFSAGVAAAVGDRRSVGPYFIRRVEDALIVGEIGGAIDGGGTVEIGYAIVESEWSCGHATAATAAFAELARERGDIRALVAHTPLERPASGRVVAKCGFTPVAETDDPDSGMRVTRWELVLS